MNDTSNMDRRGFLGLAGAGLMTLALAACGSGEDTATVAVSDGAQANATEESTSAAAGEAANAAAGAGKGLIVLWSWSGNTLRMAERIRELSGADIHRLEAAEPYPDTDHYEECAERAKEEQDAGIYPAIANPVEGWEDYDTIYLGYPIWWYHLPMIVQGFVRDHDWAGKTVVPFNSHLGSGNGGTYDDLREMCGTTVLDGIAISGDGIESGLGGIDAWYQGLWA